MSDPKPAKTRAKKAKLKPGDVMVIPLREGTEFSNGNGFGLGLVMGSDGWSTVVLWLFGPAQQQPPTLQTAAELIRPETKLFAKVTGAQRAEERWQNLGQLPGFDPDRWPRPEWGSRGPQRKGYLEWFEFPPRKKAVEAHRVVSLEEAMAAPPPSSSGVGAVEQALTDYLIDGTHFSLFRGAEREAVAEKMRERKRKQGLIE